MHAITATRLSKAGSEQLDTTVLLETMNLQTQLFYAAIVPRTPYKTPHSGSEFLVCGKEITYSHHEKHV